MAAVDRTPNTGKDAAKPRGVLVPILAAAVLSSAIAAGAVFFITKKPATPAEAGEAAAAGHEDGKGEAHGEAHGDGKSGKKGAATYFALSPAFVVNLNDSEVSRFLQVDMEVMTRDPAVVEAVKLHMPQIRNSLLMLLGQQKMHELDTREGKEALQKQVLEAIQTILTTETSKPGVEAVYFTSFVMQ